jgi:hypothetical protein
MLTDQRPALVACQQVYACSALGTDPVTITALTFYANLHSSTSSIMPATYTFRLAATDARVGCAIPLRSIGRQKPGAGYRDLRPIPGWSMPPAIPDRNPTGASSALRAN